MRIYFLGTGTSQGIPVIGSDHPVCKSTDARDRRLRVSAWISWGEHSLVIDCGPDFRQQMLTSGCTKIDGILYTHEHADHTAGLDDIRPFNFRQGAMPLYAHRRVLDDLAKRFDYVFETDNKYPGAPSVLPIEVLPDVAFPVGDLTAIPINVWHGSLQVFGYRIGDFAYLTDAKTIEPREIEKLRGVKVLVVNALREEPHHSHFNLNEALDFIHLVRPERTYLTHISHTFGFHEDIQRKLPKGVFVAHDNLSIHL